MWTAVGTPHHLIYAPDKAIDGIIGHHESFGALWNWCNWLYIDFGEQIWHVTFVELLKREGVEDRLSTTEVKIGDTPLPAGWQAWYLDFNELCDTFGAASWDTEVWFNCSTPLTGRYMSVQSTIWAYLELDEIWVHKIGRDGLWLNVESIARRLTVKSGMFKSVWERGCTLV